MMAKRLLRLLLAAAALCLSGVAAPAALAGYTALDLYTLGPAPGLRFVYSLQDQQTADSGHLVGYAVINSSTIGLQAVTHALLWNGQATAVDLHPTRLPGIETSLALGTGDSQQVGSGRGVGTGFALHAMLWNGTADSAVDLNPANLGFDTSDAVATRGGQQVGFGRNAAAGMQNHALLWYGNAASAVDLNPTLLPGFESSSASGTDGARQVGFGHGIATSTAGYFPHALLWSGTAESAVDLHPTQFGEFDGSSALAISGPQQVGYGNLHGPGNTFHALLWTGTADSAVDLHPTQLLGIESSIALTTNGVQQAGYGIGPPSGPSATRALVWSGTPESAVDLQQLLPDGYFDSEANFIDPSGNVFGTAFDSTGAMHAIEWSVPEPTGLPLAVVAVLGLPRRRRRIR